MGVLLPLSSSNMTLRAFQLYEGPKYPEDRELVSTTEEVLLKPTLRPIASQPVTGYYGDHGDDMGLILLFIVGGLATTSLLIASLVFAFGLRRKMRKRDTFSGSSTATHSDSECSGYEHDYESPSADTRSDAAALVPIDRGRDDYGSGGGCGRKEFVKPLKLFRSKISGRHKSHCNSSETQMSSQTSVPSGGASRHSRNGCKHVSHSVTATHSYHIQTQTLSIDDYNHMDKIEEEDIKHSNLHRHHPQGQGHDIKIGTNHRSKSTTDGVTFKCD